MPRTIDWQVRQLRSLMAPDEAQPNLCVACVSMSRSLRQMEREVAVRRSARLPLLPQPGTVLLAAPGSVPGMVV